MKTGTLALVAAAACIPLASLDCVNADERQDSASMGQLLAEVQKAVPPAWLVEVKLADPVTPSQPGPHPTLVVKSAEPVWVEHFFPNQPPISPKAPPAVAMQVVEIKFIAFPFLSPDQYKMIREQNNTQLQARLQFQRERMGNIPSGWMGPMPFPPQAYRPRTEDEVQRVRQYAFLWVSTEPHTLPTHHTDHLAFQMIADSGLRITDAKKSEEYTQVLRAVQRIIVPYANEP